MIRNNIGNQAVIKAITIGISAVLATAQPISVLAVETGEGQPEEQETYSDIEKGIADGAQEAVDAVNEAIESSDSTVNDATDAIEDIAKEQVTVFEEGEAGKNAGGEDNATKVKEAIDTVAEDNTLTDVQEKMDNINNDLIIIENVDLEETKLAEDTVEQVNEAVKVAEDVVEYMDAATTTADELQDAIVNAKSVKMAKEAYEELTKLAEEAADEVAKASQNFADIEAKYDAAKEKLLAAAKTYNAVVSNASADASAAKEALEEAEKNVEALKAAAEEAKEGVKATSDGALKIMAIQEEVANNTATNWKAEDRLFNAIVENYYINSVEKDATNVKSVRIQGADDGNYNYFKVTYKDANGKNQVKYLNYSMEIGSKSNIRIFEKTAEEVEASMYLNSYLAANNIKKTDQKKEVAATGVFSYVEDGVKKYITGKELTEMGADIVTVDGVKYIKGEATGKDILVTAVVAPDKSELEVGEKASAVDIAESSKAYTIVDGVLTLVETADVTTTDYQRLQTETGEFKKGGYTEAEKNALIAALGEDISFEEVIDVMEKDANGEAVKYYVLTGTSYVPTFTTEGISVNRRCDSGKTLELFGQDIGEENAKKEVEDDIQGSLNGSKYTIVENNLEVEYVDSLMKSGDEDYTVTGTVKVIINDCVVTLNAADFTTGEFTSENAAKLALEKLVAGYLDNDGANAEVMVNTEYNGVSWPWNIGKVEKTYTYKTTEDYKDLQYTTEEYNKYSCYIDYLKMINEDIEEGKTISLEKYEKALAVSEAIEQNKNKYENNFLLIESKDEGLAKFLNGAKDLLDKYGRIVDEAEVAQEKLATSEKKVDDLIEAIDDLKNQDNKILTAVEALGVEDLATYFGIDADAEEAAKLNEMTLDEAIKYLDDKLAKAKENLNQAKIEADGLKDKLDEAENDLKNTIRRLTPQTPEAMDDTPVIDATGDDTTVVAILPTETGTTTVDLNQIVANANIAYGQVAGANRDEVVAIGDNEIPLTGEVEKKTSPKKEKNGNKKVAQIGDNEVPLAGTIVDKEAAHSWWWWILVAIASAFGYGTYKYNDSKKKEKVTSDSEE